MNWISVKDKLPELGTPVLVYCEAEPNPIDKQYIDFRYKNNLGEFWDIGGATHWQLLPPPPNESEKK
jgi:hypothetical protein